MFPADTSIWTIWPNPTIRQLDTYREYKLYIHELNTIANDDAQSQIEQQMLLNGG